MRIRRAFACLAAIALSGCAITDHFDSRVDRFNVAAEQARDQIILTNIVRASRAEPIAFLNLGQISGSTQTSGVMGLPSLVLGPLSPIAATARLQRDLIFGGSAAGGQGYVGNQTSIQGSTGIQATPAETKDFYTGLLSEVQPYTLQFFVEQGMSRELLFYLFTSAVFENGREIRNDPLNRAEFREFQTVVRLAVDYGLSTEPIPENKERKIHADGQKNNHAGETQLCFNLHARSPSAPLQRLSPICGSKSVSADPRTVQFGSLRVTVVPRSVFGIFQFLGKLLASGQRVQLYSANAIGEPPLRDPYLFTVLTTPTIGGCFLNVTYEGASYCVPIEGAENTKRIISILTQLLALNTSIQDIPISPNVQILP